MLRFFILALTVALPWSLTGCAAMYDVRVPEATVSMRTALDGAVPALLREHGVPSVSIAVLRGGRAVLVAAYGEQAPGSPATTRTLYNIASMTKPISAEVVLRLVSGGRLSLDEPMYAYWVDPDLADDPRHRQLTPRIALSHRTGFANWRRETGGVLRFRGQPGETIGYSGEGYEYVARFAERRTAEPFDALARRLVFGPSGMRSTAYTGQAWFAGRVAQPSTENGFIAPTIAEEWVASDDMHSTAADYARFIASLVRSEGLVARISRERTSVQADRTGEICNTDAKRAACPMRAGFGLGWEVYDFGDDRFLMHTGSDTGEFAFAYFSPVSGDGAVVFTNSNRGGLVVLPILERIGADVRFVAFLRAQIQG